MADKSSLENKLEELSKEYSKTKYNKATNKHLGILRKKISEIKKSIVESGRGQKGKGFFVKKTGDATVALMGFPSTGKSSIINVLTSAKSKTARYEFTTTTVIPGIMFYNEARIQIFDMPGIIENAHLGAGGGRSVIAAMRVADLIIFVIDIDKTVHLQMLLDELKALNVLINKPKPKIFINESSNAIGLLVESNRSKLSEREIQMVISEFGTYNARIRIDENITIEELIGFVSSKNHYMRGIVALNKIDLNSDYEKVAGTLSSKYNIEVLPISATQNINIDKLKTAIYRNLNIMTIYLKPKDEDIAKPLILKAQSTVGEAAAKLHTEILDNLKCAYISGPSAKFNRQRVGTEHVLKEGDTITFIKNR
ncbi:MAG: GTPase [Candidatus Micrarchaeaceae archaeon]|jgi:ribosome-interacting GTPase 1